MQIVLLFPERVNGLKGEQEEDSKKLASVVPDSLLAWWVVERQENG